MGTAFTPARTSPASWDAFSDIEVFVDAVLVELAAMVADGTGRTRSGPKPPLTGAALRRSSQWRSGASRSAACSGAASASFPFGTLYTLFAPGSGCGVACSTA
jgi:hypothetical protein